MLTYGSTLRFSHPCDALHLTPSDTPRGSLFGLKDAEGLRQQQFRLPVGRIQTRRGVGMNQDYPLFLYEVLIF